MRLAMLVLITGTACASVYDDALAAYWREDNITAFDQCVAALEARPTANDAAHALYLMEVICTSKLNAGAETQIVARLQQTWHGLLYETFCQTTAHDKKDRIAQKLADLWRHGVLSDAVKMKLTQEHFRLVLRQLPLDYPAWEVRNESTFSFPEIWTEFTPTLFVNGEVKWAPDRSQRSQAMSVSGGDPITSMSGGEFKNGDVLQCRIDLKQSKGFEISLWTNKIVLQGLKK